MRAAITPRTAAILIESIQGESGITVATPEYLLGLRKLCDERRFCCSSTKCRPDISAPDVFTAGSESWKTQQILVPKLHLGTEPRISNPTRSRWRNRSAADFRSRFLGARTTCRCSLGRTHATTFGGNPLAAPVALKVLEVIERDQLAENARELGRFISDELQRLIRKFPRCRRKFAVRIDDRPGVS